MGIVAHVILKALQRLKNLLHTKKWFDARGDASLRGVSNIKHTKTVSP